MVVWKTKHYEVNHNLLSYLVMFVVAHDEFLELIVLFDGIQINLESEGINKF